MQASIAKCLTIIVAMALFGSASATAASLITSARIADGTIKLRDLSPAVRKAIAQPRASKLVAGAQGLSGAVGNAGPAGPTGVAGQSVTGPQGAKGQDGAAGATGAGWPTYSAALTRLAPVTTSGETVFARCDAGTKLISGGYDLGASSTGKVLRAELDPGSNAFILQATFGPSDPQPTALAYCGQP